MTNNTYRYTINIPHSEHDIISFLETKRKTIPMSAYIRNLIRKDMGQANAHEEQYEDMYQYLLRRLQETGHLGSENQQKPLVDEMDKEIIINLF